MLFKRGKKGEGGERNVAKQDETNAGITVFQGSAIR